MLVDIQARVEEEGWHFPLDLASRGSCQIGGNVATNAGGSRVIKYGNVRNSVLGLDAVLANGSTLGPANRLVKDNAGYSLSSLLRALPASFDGRRVVLLETEGRDEARVREGIEAFLSGALEEVDLTSAAPHLKSGNLKALAVTSAARSKVVPDIPTVAEEGVMNYAAVGWMGLFAPAQTPRAIVDRLSKAVQNALAKPEVQQQIGNLAAEPAYLDAAAFQKFAEGGSAKWAQVIATTVKTN